MNRKRPCKPISMNRNRWRAIRWLDHGAGVQVNSRIAFSWACARLFRPKGQQRVRLAGVIPGEEAVDTRPISTRSLGPSRKSSIGCGRPGSAPSKTRRAHRPPRRRHPTPQVRERRRQRRSRFCQNMKRSNRITRAHEQFGMAAFTEFISISSLSIQFCTMDNVDEFIVVLTDYLTRACRREADG